MEGSGRSKEVTQPESEVGLGNSRHEAQITVIDPTSSSSGEGNASAVQIQSKESFGATKQSGGSVLWAYQVDIEEAQKLAQDASAIPKEVEPQVPKNWVQILKEDPNRGFQLHYIPPKKTVVFSADEWNEGADIWKHAVVGDVLAFKPSHTDM